MSALVKLAMLVAVLLTGCAHLLVPEGKCPFPGRAGSSSADLPDLGTTECKLVCVQAIGHVSACEKYGPPPVKATVYRNTTPARGSREPVLPFTLNRSR